MQVTGFPGGLNVWGATGGQCGISESLRGFLSAARGGGVPHVARSLEDGGSGAELAPYGLNCLYFNPPVLRRQFLPRFVDCLPGRHNVGFWYWESTRLRSSWSRCRAVVNEIWTGSEYCREIFERELQLPTAVIPPVVEPLGRTMLDSATDSNWPEPTVVAPPLPRDLFVVLCCYDYRSCVDRKNPQAAIKAFRSAFAGQRDVLLILKAPVAGLKRRLRQRHRSVARRCWQRTLWPSPDPRIQFLGEYLDTPSLNGLMARVDCLLSLHRSEGFGLHLAEAMYHGKPVIATAYSGNLDYMTPQNSYLVGFRLARTPGLGTPYPLGGMWAEPDVAHAAELLRRVYSHREEAETKGRLAADRIRASFSVERVASQLRTLVEARCPDLQVRQRLAG